MIVKENVLSSKEFAKPIIIINDIVYIHSNHKEVIETDIDGNKHDLCEYTEIQMNKDELLVYLFNEIQQLKGTNNDN